MICSECGRRFEDTQHPDVPICQECRADIALSEDEEMQLELAKDDPDEYAYVSYVCEAKSAGTTPITLSEWLTQQERL